MFKVDLYISRYCCGLRSSSRPKSLSRIFWWTISCGVSSNTDPGRALDCNQEVREKLRKFWFSKRKKTICKETHLRFFKLFAQILQRWQDAAYKGLYADVFILQYLNCRNPDHLICTQHLQSHSNAYTQETIRESNVFNFKNMRYDYNWRYLLCLIYVLKCLCSHNPLMH